MNQILCGDASTVLKTLPDESIQCCVTSPPYFGHRCYGVKGQIGLEESVEEYVEKLVLVFQEVKRVLKKNGSLFIVIGDSYRDKQVLGIPWRLAFSLQNEGWILRQDCIWSKKNPLPESVKDRCTRSHEYVFLLSKTKKYYFNSEAIQEDTKYAHEAKWDNGLNGHGGGSSKKGQGSTTRKFGSNPLKKNKRSVWCVNTKPILGLNHFATFPPDLIEPCILAGSKKGDLILDPFFGSGTTGIVSQKLNRNYLGIELNPEYIQMAEKRIQDFKKKVEVIPHQEKQLELISS